MVLAVARPVLVGLFDDNSVAIGGAARQLEGGGFLEPGRSFWKLDLWVSALAQNFTFYVRSGRDVMGAGTCPLFSVLMRLAHRRHHGRALDRACWTHQTRAIGFRHVSTLHRPFLQMRHC